MRGAHGRSHWGPAAHGLPEPPRVPTQPPPLLPQSTGSQLTALAVAARNGYPQVVKLLLEAGPNSDTLDNALVFAGKMGSIHRPCHPCQPCNDTIY